LLDRTSLQLCPARLKKHFRLANGTAVKLRSIDPGILYEGLDRQNLTQIRRRFVAINNDRLKRLRDALSERQRLVLDAIPLLFHTNHPMMPGYVGRQTPARLSRFSMCKDAIKIGRMIARSFTVPHDVSQPEQIYSLFVMGSVGTIAQSEKSDLDIWLCHEPGLGQNAVAKLNQKAIQISEWALSFRLEVHFFLMDHEQFKQGQLPALNEESSGSAQQLLLLDEFYRTAIHIGGRKPLWWFVPAKDEQDYARYSHTLVHRRFINGDSVLDFGGIATIPPSEFVGAGIWQLYKAIESPYKSVLKLLLLEAYIDQYPNIQPLSLQFKQQVYDGYLNIDNLDSYVMIYRHIEHYLKANRQFKRLELARRCFYFKVNKSLSKPPKGREKSWQRRLLEQLTSEWGWDHNLISTLDERHHWKTLRVADERSQLVGELNHSYKSIQEFALKTGTISAISAEEYTILGRKLQAVFERRQGKVEWINPGISRDLSETTLSISETFDENSGMDVWTASTRQASTGINTETVSIKSATSLTELLMWLHFNGIVDQSTYLDVPNGLSVNQQELRKMITSIQRWLPLPLPPVTHETFQRAAVPVGILILLNVGKSTTRLLDDQGIQRLSNHADALCYSGFEDNLVASVDMVIRNSWGELNCRRFEKTSALLEALEEYLVLSVPGSYQNPPALTVECLGSSHSAIISKRVQQWFAEITQCYYGGQYPAATRYIFEMGGAFYSLQFQGPKLLTRHHLNDLKLQEFLGEQQLAISPIKIDSRALINHPLRTIAETISGDIGGRAWSGAIHVFYERFDIGMQINVVDEMGCLFRRKYHIGKNHSPLKALQRFLRAISDRQTRMNQELLYDFGVFPIHFFELNRQGVHYRAHPRRIPREQPTSDEFSVKAVAQRGTGNAITYDFYCDDQEFLSRAFGENLYVVVAQHILKLRSNNDNYPVYLSDLELSLCQQQLSENGRLSTIHYLREKEKLEHRLNQAIGILLKP